MKNKKFSFHVFRGSPSYQIHFLFDNSGINAIGESKHEAKQIARANGATSWEDLGKQLGIYSYKTADGYRDAWIRFFKFSKSWYGIRNIFWLDDDMVQFYLMETVIKPQKSHATLMTYCSALSKMELALNLFYKKYKIDRTANFQPGIAFVRNMQSLLWKPTETRAYERPEAIVDAIEDPHFHLAATMQLEQGCRINEIGHIRKINLFHDELHARGKGGKYLIFKFAPETFLKLKKIIETAGEFILDKDAYRYELKKAAKQTNQKYQGSHGLRWNFAQRRMVELNKGFFSRFDHNCSKPGSYFGEELPLIRSQLLPLCLRSWIEGSQGKHRPGTD